jgi:hypothetical protein
LKKKDSYQQALNKLASNTERWLKIRNILIEENMANSEILKQVDDIIRKKELTISGKN